MCEDLYEHSVDQKNSSKLKDLFMVKIPTSISTCTNYPYIYRDRKGYSTGEKI